MPMPRVPDKPFAPLGKPQQIHPGVSYRTYRRKNGLAVVYNICCDCGLTHLEAIRVNKRYLTCYTWRDEAQTRKIRKRIRKRRLK